MKITYIGGDVEGVYIPDLGDLHCDQGGTIDVPEAIGENLLAQSTWEAAPTKAAKAADKETS